MVVRVDSEANPWVINKHKEDVQSRLLSVSARAEVIWKQLGEEQKLTEELSWEVKTWRALATWSQEWEQQHNG